MCLKREITSTNFKRWNPIPDGTSVHNALWEYNGKFFSIIKHCIFNPNLVSFGSTKRENLVNFLNTKVVCVSS